MWCEEIMRRKFNLSKYDADKGKSYEFCQERKTMEDETNIPYQQGKRIISNSINSIAGICEEGLIRKSEECPKLDVLDCCELAVHKRTKPECKVCVGNV